MSNKSWSQVTKHVRHGVVRGQSRLGVVEVGGHEACPVQSFERFMGVGSVVMEWGRKTPRKRQLRQAWGTARGVRWGGERDGWAGGQGPETCLDWPFVGTYHTTSVCYELMDMFRASLNIMRGWGLPFAEEFPHTQLVPPLNFG